MAERPCTEREAELLTATLDVLRECGFDRLTVDEVVARARASKATVYRRWPSKGDLVVAAFAHGVRQEAVAPNTGSLRGDLMHIGTVVLAQATKYGTAIGGILAEVRRSPQLRAEFEQEFEHERKALFRSVLAQAVERGEIRPDVVDDEIWDVLPGYLIFRALTPGRPPTAATVTKLVDDVLLPSLTRTV